MSLSEQHILVYGRSGLLAQSRVSTGMAGHRTPAGVFSILQRSRHHRSNIYSNAPMPYMQRLTWSGIALHAGVVPRYPASHGCIRLPFPFAAKLWGMAEIGTRVVVTPDDASAVPIEHARLPTPRLAPAFPDEAGEVASDDPPVPGPALASAAGATVTDAAGELGLSGVRLLTPWQRAMALKARAADNVTATTEAARLAAKTAKATAAEAGRTARARQAAEGALEAAWRRHERAAEALQASALEQARASELASAELVAAEAALAGARLMAEEARLLDVVRGDDAAARADAAEARRAARARRDAEEALEAAWRRHERAAEAAEASALKRASTVERASAALAAAEAALPAARMAADETRLLDAVQKDDAAAAGAARVCAENARRAAVDVRKAVRRIGEPISIFVSRKTGRVYIRRAWKQIHEAPATFTDGPPLGTHVYLATSRAADGGTLDWLSVSLQPSARTLARLRNKARESAPPAASGGLPHETAATVLDRFELPEATRRFIADRLWAGATLIVSDNGMSHETGEYTDFIVLTR